MTSNKEQKIREIFYKCYSGSTDWSLAADKFIEWTIENDFQTESFREFVSWIDDDELNRIWDFFFDYGDDYELFAEHWIEPEEQKDYLNYCLSQQ